MSFLFGYLIEKTNFRETLDFFCEKKLKSLKCKLKIVILTNVTGISKNDIKSYLENVITFFNLEFTADDLWKQLSCPVFFFSLAL